jgi:signal transduction histidine kinase|nr:ATP-binding protein [Kofleriaceae bacterium]
MTERARAAELLVDARERVYARTSRMFLGLFVGQWLFAIALAAVTSPYAFEGSTRSVHLHLQLAIFLGGAINVLPCALLVARPSWWLTRHCVAAVQMLWSALLIVLTGGRIETHFHVFGSLAFIAFYRDWKLLVTATIVVSIDHLARGVWWPDSVYGIANPEWWRFLEHAAWVTFEDVVLVWGCVRGVSDLRETADRTAEIEHAKGRVVAIVDERTRELRASIEQLARAKKLESIGRLAAGVAHEINTPIQFVGDSIDFVGHAVGELVAAASRRRDAFAGVDDLEFVLAELPRALARAGEGVERVASIVRSMKVFAHPDRTEMAHVDLNAAIESTTVIARNEYRYVADLELQLGELPPVCCHVGEINQVVLNMVVNAAHAIESVVGASGSRGRIVVATFRDRGDACIDITDTGAGIPADLRDKVFDPFFTTKPAGKGTGQGLAMAHAVVVEKHRGSLSFDSELGAGTTFHIRIPVVEQLEVAA